MARLCYKRYTEMKCTDARTILRDSRCFATRYVRLVGAIAYAIVDCVVD